MKIYNTMSRSKDELVPLHPDEIRMYVCGVTVYDFSHIGHARSALVFDVLRRYLKNRDGDYRDGIFLELNLKGLASLGTRAQELFNY